MAGRKPPISEILKLLKAKCKQCGSQKELEVNHITPLSKGGTNKAANLQILCRKCHDRYHGHIPKKAYR